MSGEDEGINPSSQVRHQGEKSGFFPKWFKKSQFRRVYDALNDALRTTAAGYSALVYDENGNYIPAEHFSEQISLGELSYEEAQELRRQWRGCLESEFGAYFGGGTIRNNPEENRADILSKVSLSLRVPRVPIPSVNFEETEMTPEELFELKTMLSSVRNNASERLHLRLMSVEQGREPDFGIKYTKMGVGEPDADTMIDISVGGGKEQKEFAKKVLKKVLAVPLIKQRRPDLPDKLHL